MRRSSDAVVVGKHLLGCFHDRFWCRDLFQHSVIHYGAHKPPFGYRSALNFGDMPPNACLWPNLHTTEKTGRCETACNVPRRRICCINPALPVLLCPPRPAAGRKSSRATASPITRAASSRLRSRSGRFQRCGRWPGQRFISAIGGSACYSRFPLRVSSCGCS